MAPHEHRWRKVYEMFIGGGHYFGRGWECELCRERAELTPAGLPGVVLEKAARLIGPHGMGGRTEEGVAWKEQIIDEFGELTIVPFEKAQAAIATEEANDGSLSTGA